jgi:hypothetical protein
MVLLDDGNYGDLIKFYNRVFAPTVGPFARQFSSSSDFHTIHMTNLPLSPLPQMRQTEFSPRRLSSKHSIFISPHKGWGHPMGGGDSSIELLFEETRQKKALNSINEAINGGKIVGAAKRKRGLEFDNKIDNTIGPGLSKRLKAIKSDRFNN